MVSHSHQEAPAHLFTPAEEWSFFSLLALALLSHTIAMSNIQSRPECQQAFALNKAVG